MCDLGFLGSNVDGQADDEEEEDPTLAVVSASVGSSSSPSSSASLMGAPTKDNSQRKANLDAVAQRRVRGLQTRINIALVLSLTVYVLCVVGVLYTQLFPCSRYSDEIGKQRGTVCAVNLWGGAIGLTVLSFGVVNALGFGTGHTRMRDAVFVVSFLTLAINASFILTAVGVGAPLPQESPLPTGVCTAVNGSRGISECGNYEGYIGLPPLVGLTQDSSVNGSWVDFGRPMAPRTVMRAIMQDVNVGELKALIALVDLGMY